MHLQYKPRSIRHANDLPDTTLVVIGLWNMGYQDLDTVARLLWVADRKPLERLFRMLQNTRNKLIRRYVDCGLPPGIYRRFPFPDTTVRCHLCGTMIEWVPCPRCSLKAVRNGTEFLYRKCRSQPILPQHSTTAIPGSPKKIAVMAERFERGEMVIHPNDLRMSWRKYRELQQRS
jgi:hypothetical protein